MKGPARQEPTEPILMDRAANYFGTEGAGFNFRSFLRESGSLTLTEDYLRFDPSSGAAIEIPIDQIQGLGIGHWHKYRTSNIPVLKVTHQKNLVLGVIVDRPDRWINAIEALAAGTRQKIQVEHRNDDIREMRKHFRLVMTLFLVLILFITIVLPIFFSWVQSRAHRDAQEMTPPAPVSTQTG